MKISLGTDIGGTNTCVGSVSQDGKVLHKETFATSDYSDGTAYADRLAEAVRAVISQTESQQPEIQFEWLGLGIGAPNGNHRSGCIEHPPNLNFKGITPLVELMQARLKLPTVDLTNDANAAAIGEKKFGAAKDYSDFIMITLGTGLGSGVFVNNNLSMATMALLAKSAISV